MLEKTPIEVPLQRLVRITVTVAVLTLGALLLSLANRLTGSPELSQQAQFAQMPVASPQVLISESANALVPVDIHKFALNAFLVDLMDDGTPSRWTDVALDFTCDVGTRVFIDGQPLLAGGLVPTAAFNVRWEMSNCEPLGPAVQFSGAVDLYVSREHGRLVAVVVPDRLLAQGSWGSSSLNESFFAELSVEKPLLPTPLVRSTGLSGPAPI